MARYFFPRWANLMPAVILFGVLGPFGTAALGAVWYYGTDKFLAVGYTPTQPVDYSHKLHAGDMGMDCRYCHTTVEETGFAAVPSTQTCMNCHAKVKTDSVKLLPVRESWATGEPIPWVRVHNLPDYAFFNHSVHVAANVGCASCHGRVDQMVKVSQVQPLTMGWCLDCHRNPGPHLRPAGVAPTDMAWKPDEARLALSPADPHAWKAANGRTVTPPVHCSGCHR